MNLAPLLTRCRWAREIRERKRESRKSNHKFHRRPCTFQFFPLSSAERRKEWEIQRKHYGGCGQQWKSIKIHTYMHREIKNEMYTDEIVKRRKKKKARFTESSFVTDPLSGNHKRRAGCACCCLIAATTANGAGAAPTVPSNSTYGRIPSR